ncbi:hypothetical protein NIES4071_110090 (plasmid) [Calothrix sp. NIES-4071]|nr:hypothetical protein NIES4071_110090 [Calothrix sp. NIES-4071]
MIDLALTILLTTSQPRNNQLPQGWEIPCAIGFGLGILFSRAQPQRTNSQASSSEPDNILQSNSEETFIEAISKTGELNLDKFISAGRDIIKGFAVSDRSQLVVAPSRCGKTTIIYLMLEAFFKRHSDMQCYVWQGKGIQCVHPKIPRFNHTLFEESEEVNLTALNNVFKVYKARKIGDDLSRSLVKLVITDWQSIKDGVSITNPKLFQSIASRIRTIANNGAELGVTVVIDSQSANIDDLGLGSASLRDNFDIYAVSRLEYIEESVKGDIKALPKLIKNDDIVVNTKERDDLLNTFELLRQELGKSITSSIILTTVGMCRLGITPSFERKNLTWFSETAKNNFETAKQREINGFSDSETQCKTSETTTQQTFEDNLDESNDFVSETLYTALKLPKNEALEVVSKLRNAKHNQTQIIKLLWRASPGDNEPYKTALDEYKELTR